MTLESSAVDLRANILLVDDRPQNLIALQAILEPLGQNLVLAHSGREALKAVLHADFALILLDVLMPDLDGFETARLIKQREQSHSIPIIFLTAVSTHEQFVGQGYSVGAVDYIAKPFDVEILRSKVSVFVDLYKKNVEIKRQAALLRLAQEREREREIAELKRDSENRYQRLAESLPQVVWTATPGGTTTYCNRPWLPVGADSLPWTRMIHPEDLPEFKRQWEHALAGGEEFECDVRVRSTPGAGYRWHGMRVLPVFDEPRSDSAHAPKVASWVGTCTDIHDRRHARETLRFLAEASTILAESLDHLATVPRVARLAVAEIADWCVIDIRAVEGPLKRLAVAYANPSQAELARDIERLPPREPQDPSAGDETIEGHLLGPEASAPDLQRWRARFSSTSSIVVPLRARGLTVGCLAMATAGSRERFTPTERSVIESLAEKIVAAVDNAELYESARHERARLEKANRAKDEFLAIVSHELRTPLNAVLGWTHLLRTGDVDSETLARGLETIERNARSQAKLIGDILDVSRIISGKLELKLTRADLAEVLHAALDSMRPEAESKGVEIQVESVTTCPLNADAERLKQVASNLLSNAIKFTPAGGHIAVRLFPEADGAVLEVADDGCGIDPRFLPYVFDPFAQGDSGVARSYGGLGLGLSIVRQLVTMHGGRVHAHSDGLEKGATFTVHLPCNLPLPVEVGSQTSQPADESGGRQLAGLRVLVVEDVPDGRELIERVLAKSGAEVTAVGSAAEALNALSMASHDVIVSDIGLPGESGYDLIRKLRSLGSDLPAIALTAFASEADRHTALAAGFQAHAPKPVDAEALVKLLSRLAARR